MKQNVIFKAAGNGHIYKVVESPKRSVFGEKMFRVIKDRKWLDGAEFFKLEYAISTACTLAAPSDIQLMVGKIL